MPRRNDLRKVGVAARREGGPKVRSRQQYHADIR